MNAKTIALLNRNIADKESVSRVLTFVNTVPAGQPIKNIFTVLENRITKLESQIKQLKVVK
jgi:hypothetical protein